jgi:hypothetical protein
MSIIESKNQPIHILPADEAKPDCRAKRHNRKFFSKLPEHKGFLTLSH